MAASPKRVTLKDVAARAGVSTATVSIVLLGKEDLVPVNAQTAMRVREAADALGYAPNLLVRCMKQGRTGILGFYNSYRNYGIDDLHMSRLVAAMQRATRRRDGNLLIYTTFGRSPEETYHFLAGGHIDGLVLYAPAPTDPLLQLLRPSRLATVLMNGRDEQGEFPCVRDDVADGMNQVADELIRLGHSRVGCVVEVDAHPDAAERISLLEIALAVRGAEPVQHVIHEGEARDQIHRVLNQPDAPTALFFWRDRLAYWWAEACQKEGIDVPGRVSIVGYDGLQWPAATPHVVASVHVDLELLADATLDILEQQISEEPITEDPVLIPVTFSHGTTLGPA